MNPIEVNEEFDPIDKLIQEFPAVFQNMDNGAISSIPSGWYNILYIDTILNKVIRMLNRV